MPNFRLQARKVFLTYSQAADIEDYFTLWKHLSQLKGVSNTLVSEEKHADGNTHYHAIVEFKRKPVSTSRKPFVLVAGSLACLHLRLVR